MQATITSAPTPGKQSSEFKVTLLTMGATVAIGVLKVAGVAVLATGAWWALPASLAIASFGYSISRGLAKRGVDIRFLPVGTVGEPAKPTGV
jgi:hypothetical protein